MNDEDLVKRVVKMVEALRSLGGSDRLYVFSPFFKPVDIDLPTMFGAVFNFPMREDFSEEKIRGFKDIVNSNSDLLTGYVIIGNQAYKPEADHEYKTLSLTKSSELRKALVGRAVKVGRFDLSMLNPGWLRDNEGHNSVESDPHHTMQEATWEFKPGDAHKDLTTSDPMQAIEMAMQLLKTTFGEFSYQEIQVQEMVEMLEDATPPYYVELTASKEGVQVVGDNNVGVMLYNEGGELYWEF